MNSTLRYYLGEVLGLDLVPHRPPPKVQTESLAILCGYDLNESEDALLRKMMLAIGVTDYALWAEPPPGHGFGLVLGSAGAQSLGLTDLGQTVEFKGRRWLRTYALGEMLKGGEGEIQSKKRTAWGHLRIIKSWIKESQH